MSFSSKSVAEPAPSGAGSALGPTIERSARLPGEWPDGLKILALLSPALLLIVGLFLGGFAFGFLQSLGFLSLVGDGGLSLDAYRRMLEDPAVRASLPLTFRISVISTVLSAILAVASALLIRSTKRGQKFLVWVFQLNIPIPHIVGAVAMILLLQQSGYFSRFAYALGLVSSPAEFVPLIADEFGVGIIIHYMWKEIPFIGVVVLAALQSGVSDYEEVARTLGASSWMRFRHIIVPFIAPSVFSTSIIAFAFTFGSYEIPFLLGRPFPAALPVVAVQSYRDSDLLSRPEAMATSVLITVFISILVYLYMRVSDRYTRGLR